EVVAIEESRSAAADAVENVRSNGAANVSIERGSVAERLPAVAARGAIALLVLDPPRAGLEPPALDAAIAARPDRIAYLSCAPGSLARDLAALVRAGWVVDDVTPRDFLPQTDHVEALARLKRAPERGRIVEHAARGPAPQDG
ncbi:MAG TPA: hypothetical protein VKE69_06620, partial [Planctomycetota bacterium]|nr:hypothetical protein [Planctomycetota bacterium]